MALRIELEGDKPGVAKFLAQKWSGSADIDILIQRNQDGYYLSGLNQWGPEKNWHTVTSMSVENEQLSGLVDEWLVDSLLSQENSVRFLAEIRDKQNQSYIDRGVINIAETVFPSSALITSPAIFDEIEQNTFEPNKVASNLVESDDSQPVEPETEEQTIVVENEVKVEPEMESEIEVTPTSTITQQAVSDPQSTKAKSKLGLIIIIFVILLTFAGIGFAVWYFLFSQDKNPLISLTQSNSQCNIANATTDDLSFIQQCLQSKPDAGAVIDVINQAKQANKCNIAQRLYANQSLLNAKVALLYAKEYDVKFYQDNQCFKADKETAIYWYETSLNNDPNNELAKERLAELQK
ncbi:hypothetical protein H3T61_04515 [Gilliamella sp. B14384H2]|uniref:hypothetical protein n=1 Tax=unclassified Gilliamella TaxID=2685620 RepID=UPI0018DE3013|nr:MULTISPECIES: hypothetical protein [unclassified Gilliamella]MBI0037485.1 hypothetical protein [Gilliamella sp. B14384G10]MBI0040584.1 hypothetical protein [Gilliamella sp. B14384G7]MBI0052423.1 hypothetical protein [Gilliamella sp. B14384G13]MBI0053772.1 hypothetical protein [Gilliamella sp. B14384H2]